LDLLAPKSSPARPLEVMVVGGIGKTRFHQVLAPFAIMARGDAVSLSARYI
jgi:predicted ATPase